MTGLEQNPAQGEQNGPGHTKGAPRSSDNWDLSVTLEQGWEQPVLLLGIGNGNGRIPERHQGLGTHLRQESQAAQTS